MKAAPILTIIRILDFMFRIDGDKIARRTIWLNSQWYFRKENSNFTTNTATSFSNYSESAIFCGIFFVC